MSLKPRLLHEYARQFYVYILFFLKILDCYTNTNGNFMPTLNFYLKGLIPEYVRQFIEYLSPVFI